MFIRDAYCCRETSRKEPDGTATVKPPTGYPRANAEGSLSKAEGRDSTWLVVFLEGFGAVAVAAQSGNAQGGGSGAAERGHDGRAAPPIVACIRCANRHPQDDFFINNTSCPKAHWGATSIPAWKKFVRSVCKLKQPFIICVASAASLSRKPRIFDCKRPCRARAHPGAA